MPNKRKYSDFLSDQAAPEPEPDPDPATVQFPRELFDEILLWLPVKSVLRFKCLSKSLFLFIDDPEFINSHLARSSQNLNRRKMIFLGGKSTAEAKVCDMNFDLREGEEEKKEILRLENPVSLSSKEVYGYCKGLLLVAQKPFNQSRFGLWNPSTRQYQDLPDCDFGVPDDLLRQSYSIVASGLGFYDSDEDWKPYNAVFKVLFEREDEDEVQVWIYQLESDIWRRAKDDFNFDECLIPREHPGISGIGHFTDDSLHWLYTINSKTEIVAFDMREDTFSLCSQPVCSIASMAAIITKLHVLEGSLCISYFRSSPSRADLYMRKKEGEDQFIWMQLYSVTDAYFLVIYWLDSVKVLGYTKRDHTILLDLGGFMVSYDMEEKSFGEVELHRDPGCIGSMLSCLCIESLETVVGGPF